jgi:ABC-type multidrug transport system fused ATPase/permease subunit
MNDDKIVTFENHSILRIIKSKEEKFKYAFLVAILFVFIYILTFYGYKSSKMGYYTKVTLFIFFVLLIVGLIIYIFNSKTVSLVSLNNKTRVLTLEYYKWFNKHHITIDYSKIRYRKIEQKTRTLNRTYENVSLKLYLSDSSELTLANKSLESDGINFTELYNELQKIKRPF